MRVTLPQPASIARWNTATGVAVLAAQTLTFLLLSPFVLKRLGTEAFGIWSLGSTILAFATLLDLGIGEATAQRVGELGGTGADVKSVARIAAEATGHFRRMSLTGLAAAPFVSIGLIALVQFRTLSPLVVFGYFLCASSAFFVGLPSYAKAAVLVGRGETWAQRLPLMAESFVTLALSLIALYAGLGLLALGVATILSRAAGAGARIWIYHQIVGIRDFKPIRVDDRPYEPLISIRGAAAPFMMIAMAARFEISVGPLVLATRIGANEVGPYLFAFRCFFTLLQVTWQLTDYLFPAYRRLSYHAHWLPARRLTEHSLAVTLPFVASAGCFGAFAYDAVIGKLASGLVIGQPLTVVFACFTVVYHAVHVLAMSANGCGLQRRVMPIMMIESAVGFGLGVILVAWLAGAGIIAGLIVANSMIALPALSRLWARAAAAPSWPWIGPALAPAGAMVLALVAMDLALAQGTTLLVGAAALATTAALSWNLAVVFVRWPQFTTAARAALAAVRAGGSVPAEPEALL